MLSGEQWLDQVFSSALAALNRQGPDRIPADAARLVGYRLAGQVQALRVTGVLTEEQERAANAALERANVLPQVQSRSASISSASSAVVVGVPASGQPPRAEVAGREEPATLLGVLAGPREIGTINGHPVTLIAAELWSDCFAIDLYADPGQEHREQQARATREHLEWLWRRHRGLPADRPASPRVASPLDRLMWDLGEGYMRTGGSAESRDFVDRQRMRWSPAPPHAAKHVTLRATDPAGAVVLSAELPIPR